MLRLVEIQTQIQIHKGVEAGPIFLPSAFCLLRVGKGVEWSGVDWIRLDLVVRWWSGFSSKMAEWVGGGDSRE